MRHKANAILSTLLTALLALAGTSARAVDVSEEVSLHGYGDIGRARSNVDATGQELGGRETMSNLSLVGIWQASERTKVWAQLFRSSDLGKVRVDWAFVDYQSPAGQTLRVGRVRLPFGLHNESRDVQALRPSASMPYLYNEELALADESFDGASVEQRFTLGGGAATVEVFAANRLLSGGKQSARGTAIGARAIVETPVEGLSFGASAFAGRLTPDTADTRGSKRGWAASARYRHEAVDLQAEVARGFLYERRVSTWYLQAAHDVGERWQAFVRLERIVTDTAQRGDDAFQEQRWAVGTAYRINEHFGIRLEQQFHRGYAIPVLSETVEAGAGRHRWTSTLLSANYQF